MSFKKLIVSGSCDIIGDVQGLHVTVKLIHRKDHMNVVPED